MPLSASDLAYHTRQYEYAYRSTVHFAQFIRDTVGPLSGRVVDFGCGAGANLHWLREWGMLNGAHELGIDSDPEVVRLAEEHGVPAKARDMLTWDGVTEYALSIQVLSFVEDWREALIHMLNKTKKWAFISSLFWDGIEAHTHVWDKHYNVIDAGRFETVARAFAAKEVIWRELPVDTEITAPDGVMGTYTKAGMQFSGPLYLPWRFAGIRMR